MDILGLYRESGKGNGNYLVRHGWTPAFRNVQEADSRSGKEGQGARVLSLVKQRTPWDFEWAVAGADVGHLRLQFLFFRPDVLVAR